ncbi:MAG: hypothetical protein REH83_03475 [Rickettsiella sp.]|nr:hypothetical protein [Rickettsiella sp.]
MTLKISFLPLLIGVISISGLVACGGGSGGPGGPLGATGATGATGAAGASGSGGLLGGGNLLNTTLGGGNLAGVTLTSGGGVHLSAEALRRLGLNANALTRADLVDLNLTGPLPAGAEVLRSNGQIIGVQLPGQGAFGLPGAGPVALPGGVTLPALPTNLRGTVNNIVGGLRR